MITGFIGFCLWIAGIVLAKGFWSTVAAIVFPVWALLVVLWNVLESLNASR